MADETPQEKPKRRRRRTSRAPEAESASEARRASSGDEEAAAPDPSASDADVASEGELEPSAEDITAEKATEVLLEADDEAEGESELPDTDAEDDAEEAESPEEALAPEDAAPQPARKARRAAGGGSTSAAKPASRRARREKPTGPPPVVRAQAKYVRSSPRKARLVCDHIRGKSVEEARSILAHTPRAVARDWSKLLESAIANAEHNHELVGEDLYVVAVSANDGPTIRRFRPRAMGRATRIRKRTSHLTILLTPKE
jgi:large subunit ribosomal protein L22